MQVLIGRRAIATLGLGNIRLEAMSLTEVDAAFGCFDYIIAHGVYSWVPDTVQEAMLRLCAERLTDNGMPTSATTPCQAGACAA